MNLRGGCLAVAAQSLVLLAACADSETGQVKDPSTEDDDDADDDTTADDDSDDDVDPPAGDDDEDDDSDPPSNPPSNPGKVDAGGGKVDAGMQTTNRDAGKIDATTPTPSGEAGRPPMAEGGSEMPPPATGGAICNELASITNYTAAGPFKVMQKTSGSVKMWIPGVPAGCKVPVIHLANGTGGTCSAYGSTLTRFATHGFFAVCFENTNTGAGTQGITAIDTAFKEYPDLVDKRIGSTGHSQGGQASFIVLQFAEAKWGDTYTYAGLAIEPASGFGSQPAGGSWQSIYAKIKSPMSMFSGTSDALVSQSWVMQGFSALADSVEAYHYSAVGATHVPVPNSETQAMAIPWFRWKLLGDAKACEAFKALPATAQWNEVKNQNPKPCM
jgi:hypothetical protein